ncbi:sugar ABC transporter substrate-binding protein [Burkholderia multivorans]|uniref:sugar ABC transporter substrate-binding protein n=1 Tax=Burkholderia multivorans TaxID=87883 RepID=UPI0019D1D45E|nr:sugar ABC transporter substrate-binding protein [Burkholderia multivorans]MBN7130605.1 sugar ABC transporter substrate-binding protein [Burkholderia multivorans]QSL25772.1 sugar ABC transporter substrate-binding protein [Burkholderia multivorans]
MKAWKKIATVAIGLMVMAGGASAADKKFVVGYTNLADTDVFTMSRKSAFSDAAKADPNLNVIFTDANGDASRQLDQIDNFISQKVDAIVVVPVDYQGIVPGVERANKAGIPVIALGIQSAGGKYTFVGSKNFDAGRLQGEFMAAKLPKNAQILYLQGTPGLYHSKERLAGFTQALAKRPDVKVLSNLPANYDRANGMQVTEDWVQRFPKFDAIIAANDQMALGALEALKTAGRLKGVMISGIDGTADALHAIKAGEMSQSIFQNAKGQGAAAYQVIETIKSGKQPPAEVIVPFESVTKDNVGTYLK